MKPIDKDRLYLALNLLEELLGVVHAPHFELVVCGGSALIATGLISRTTRDVDVVAMLKGNMELVDPEPFPLVLVQAAQKVANSLGLPSDWLNCGPCDLFRMGLPEGFAGRLEKHNIGPCLTVHFISRLDQIHFKLYASVDRGGYHIDDLLTLHPDDEELLMASHWSMTHDVSSGYILLLKELLQRIGHGKVTERI
jgi:hypothetical protein